MNKKVTFSDLHRFAINPSGNLHIVKEVQRKDSGIISVTFIDGMNIIYGLVPVEIDKIMEVYNEKNTSK